jgi:RNA polymerase sigma factor (sigma-70 family)
LRNGNKRALRTLFLRHHDPLYQYGLAVCSQKPMVEDCLQELFYQLWDGRDSLSNVKKVKGYLWICFRRRLMNRLKGKSYSLRPYANMAEWTKQEQSVEENFINREQQTMNHQALSRAVGLLSISEREVIYLKFYEGMSYSEIEQVLGIRYQTARNYVHRAISRLREVFEDEDITIVL